jgi:hypothetical protein
MGFFSADCVGCGHPILHPNKTNPINAWMNVGVAIWPSGAIRTGFYDGYGNLDQSIDSCAVGHDTTVWHEACWVASGSPEDYRGPSPSSADQGWFFPDGAHTIPEPTTGGYEVTTVTADGCDSSSGEYASYLDAVGSLKEACEATEGHYGGIVEHTLPIDGHGIIYSIDLLDGEPVLTVHYRYHITPITD